MAQSYATPWRPDQEPFTGMHQVMNYSICSNHFTTVVVKARLLFGFHSNVFLTFIKDSRFSHIFKRLAYGIVSSLKMDLWFLVL